MSGAAEQLTLFDLDICAGRMYQDHSVQRAAKISASSSRRLSELKTAPVQCLDLTPGAGNLLGQSFWEILAWRVMDAQFWGVAQRRKRIFLVADFAGRSAPQILFEQNRLPGYSASSGGQRQGTAASAPGCSDPPGGTGPIGFDGYNGDLTGEKAATLGVNCGMSTGRNGVLTAFAANQRDEVRDLHDVAAALTAQPGMKQQTFVAGITAKGNGDCFLSEERHTALSGGGGMPGQGYPAIFTAAFSAGAGASAGSIG